MPPVDIRNLNSDEIIDVKTIIMVAKKGFTNDWSVYFGELSGAFQITPDVVQMIASEGDKVPEDAAKFHFFPDIGGGPYRA